MPNESKQLICTSDPFKEKAIEWSARWLAVRKRHPFFLLHSGNNFIDEALVQFLRTFREYLDKKDVDVILDSPGGQMEASFKSALIFQSICNYVAVIPRFAKSGATLFSLGASEIIMGRWAELGPLDPQVESMQMERHYLREQESSLEGFHAARYAQKQVLEHFNAFTRFLIELGLSAKSAVQEAVKLTEATIGKIYTTVNPFELGSSGRTLEVMEKYCLRVMQKGYNSKQLREKVVKQLVWEYPGHGFFIDFDEAKKVGLNPKAASDETQLLLDELEEFLGRVTCIGIALPSPTENKVPETKPTEAASEKNKEQSSIPELTSDEGNGETRKN